MHILITNDDGLWAPGINDLARELAKTHRVTMVAPRQEQSAKSHAITIEIPIYMKPDSEKGENPMRYCVSGTPVDCMKFALSHLLANDLPDLVISGINHGFNLGSDALYSGTVSAAMEAMFYGIPALALSIERYSPERMQEILPFIGEFIDKIYVKGQYQGLLNVNFPKKGVVDWAHTKVLNQGLQRYYDVIDARSDRKKRKYYWIGGTLGFDDGEHTDVGAIKHGYITVVPLTWVQEDTKNLGLVRELVEGD